MRRTVPARCGNVSEVAQRLRQMWRRRVNSHVRREAYVATLDSAPDCEVLNTARLGRFRCRSDGRVRRSGRATAGARSRHIERSGSRSPASSCCACRARQQRSSASVFPRIAGEGFNDSASDFEEVAQILEQQFGSADSDASSRTGSALAEAVASVPGVLRATDYWGSGENSCAVATHAGV